MQTLSKRNAEDERVKYRPFSVENVQYRVYTYLEWIIFIIWCYSHNVNNLYTLEHRLFELIGDWGCLDKRYFR